MHTQVISQAEVNRVIHCEDGAVVKFVNRMYETLTQRTVQKVARRPLPEKQPPFARNTGAAAIRASLRGAALAETSDEATRASRLQEKVGIHERSLQEERSLEPERFRVPRLGGNNGTASSTSAARLPAKAASLSSVAKLACILCRAQAYAGRRRGAACATGQSQGNPSAPGGPECLGTAQPLKFYFTLRGDLCPWLGPLVVEGCAASRCCS